MPQKAVKTYNHRYKHYSFELEIPQNDSAEEHESIFSQVHEEEN